MKKFIKIASLLIIALVAVFVAAATAFLLYFDPNDYKDWVSQKITAATGRQLTIEGDIKHTFFPWFGLQTGKVVMSNAPGFGKEAFARIDGLEIKVKVLPLLSQRIEADTVILKGLTLHLARNKHGRGNWEDLLKRTPTNKVGPAVLATPSLPPIALAIGGVVIRDARITWEDAVTGDKYTVQGLTLRTGAVKPPEPLAVAATFDFEGNNLSGHVVLNTRIAYDLKSARLTLSPTKLAITLQGLARVIGKLDLNLAGQLDVDLKQRRLTAKGLELAASSTPKDRTHVASDVKATVNIDIGFDEQQLHLDIARMVAKLKGTGLPAKSLQAELSARTQLSLKQQTLSITNLTIQTLGLNLIGSLQANQILTKPVFQGQLAAKAFNPRKVLAALGQPAIHTADPKAMQMASFKTRFKGSTNQLSLENMTLRLDDTTLTGRTGIKFFTRPITGFELTMDAIDLDRYLPPPTRKQTTKPVTPATTALAAWQLPVDVLRALWIKGKLHISRLKLANLKATNIELGVKAKDGLIRMTPAKAHLYQGRYVGKLSLDARGQRPHLTINETLAGVQFGPMLKDLGIKQPGALAGATGTINLKAKLTGDPKTQLFHASDARLQANLTGKSLPGGKLNAVMAANIGLNLDTQVVSVRHLRLEAPGTTISGDIAIKQFIDQPELAGNIAVKGNPRILFNSLGQALPRTTDPKVFSRLDLKAAIKAGSDHIHITSLTMTLDDTRMTGSLSVKDFESSAIQFDLVVGAVDVDRYLPPEKKGNTKTVATPGAMTLANLPVNTLRALDVDGRLRVSQLTVSNLKLSDVDLGMQANRGLIRLTPAKASLYDGHYTGKLSLDARGNIVKVAVDEKLSRIHIGKLLKDLGIRERGVFTQAAGNIAIKGDIFSKTATQTYAAKELYLEADLVGPSLPGGKLNVLVKTTLSGTDTRIKLRDLTLKLDDTVLEGDIELATKPKPLIRFNLTGNDLDLDRYLPATDGGRRPATTPAGGAVTAAGLPMNMLRALEADGQFRFEHLKVSNLHLNNIQMTLKGHDGLIRLQPISAQLYQGSYNGNIGLNVQGRQPRLSFDEKLSCIEIGQFLHDLRGEKPLTGKAYITMRATAEGDSLLAARRSLNGDVGFEFRNGKIRKMNAIRWMCSLPGRLNIRDLRKSLTSILLEQVTRQVIGYQANASDTTKFTEIRGTMHITNGIGRNQDLQGGSPLFRVTGAGTIDLINERVDYWLKPALVSSCTGQGGKRFQNLNGVIVPVHVTGPFTNLKFSPDLSGIATAWRQQTPTTPQPQPAPQTPVGGRLTSKVSPAGLFRMANTVCLVGKGLRGLGVGKSASRPC